MSGAFDDNPWFASLDKEDARRLIEGASRRLLHTGEMLFRQGDEVPGGKGMFYGLASGSLKISSLSHDGKEAILLMLEAGNWFGELSLIDGLPRVHDATALEPSVLLEVHHGLFNELMDRLTFSRAMNRLLVARTRTLHATMEHATLRGNRARLAHRLLMMLHGGATMAPQARRFVSVSQESLARMVGVSRPTLHKDLKELVALGAIELRYGRIGLLDLAKLSAQAGPERP